MNRRKLITGLISLVTAPAIVRAESLMPISGKRLCSYGDFVFTSEDVTWTAWSDTDLGGFFIQPALDGMAKDC